MTFATPVLKFATAADPEVEKMVAEAIRVLRDGGMTYDEEELRKTMTKRLAQVRGLPEPEETPVAKAEPKPKVDIKKERKTLTLDKVVEASATEHYWYDKPEDARFMRHFIELRRRTGEAGNLLIVGPSGSGKTEGLRRLAEQVDLPFYKFDCATVTTEDKWIGRREITDAGTFFRPSEHLRWLEGKDYKPGILCYDEINRVPPSRLNVLLPILDGSQAIFVPDMDRLVNVHPETIIVATANIGSAFGGTHVLDRAFRERFNFTIEREFPPEDEEVKILTSATGVGVDEATLIVQIANQTRRKWETDDLESPISTRTLKAAAILISSGMSVINAMEYTALPLYKADGGAQSERSMVKLILTGKSK